MQQFVLEIFDFRPRVGLFTVAAYSPNEVPGEVRRLGPASPSFRMRAVLLCQADEFSEAMLISAGTGLRELSERGHLRRATGSAVIDSPLLYHM